ncbi:transposase [bacterium]|nr:transposase [bacterium]MBU1752728.1 transposase [bacterium]
MGEKKRKKFTAQEKVGILKQHFVEKKAVSDLCDEHSVHPTIFYRWQQKFFENAASVFEDKKDKPSVLIMKKVAELENKLVRKNEVLSELMEEHIALKKSLGES